MKILYLSLLAVFIQATTANPIDRIAQLIGKGRVHEYAKMFAPTIELTMNDEVNTYSKAQAELILDRFFTENKPLSSTIRHKVSASSEYQYGVVVINTGKVVYRVAFTLKINDHTSELIEFRIENEMVK